MKRRYKTEPPTFDAEGYQTNLSDLNGTPLPELDKVQAVSHGDGTGAGRDNHRGQISGRVSLQNPR